MLFFKYKFKIYLVKIEKITSLEQRIWDLLDTDGITVAEAII